MQVIQHYKTKVLTDIDSEQCWQVRVFPMEFGFFYAVPEGCFFSVQVYIYI